MRERREREMSMVEDILLQLQEELKRGRDISQELWQLSNLLLEFIDDHGLKVETDQVSIAMSEIAEGIELQKEKDKPKKNDTYRVLDEKNIAEGINMYYCGEQDGNEVYKGVDTSNGVNHVGSYNEVKDWCVEQSKIKKTLTTKQIEGGAR